MEFVKGHGTENDFVVLPDLDDQLDLTVARVQTLCDRQRGLGADGVLRVVRADGKWFMDYRNADGSIAEMCGNGLRVFARYLVDAGHQPQGSFVVATRAGDKTVTTHPDGSVTNDMGPARITGTSIAAVDGQGIGGFAVDVGNPHLACVTEVPVESFDLTVPPGFDPVMFPHGVNVELINTIGDNALRMRVYERGVGETRSCGTGTVASVASWLAGQGKTTGSATVDVLGGQVFVTIEPTTSTLTGPAMLVARGELDKSWWDALQ
ncbi:diaminopimelate epimerase [Lentzea aerocolonigenes]|uniref:diaminopimelate epimerase n=1 Tax=Lentzea aerocolonigenes TaxID=68170 RepID=UPI0004C3DA0E|nr:diaminopimelate epimerase [Lentzea aerocolonigenes]MCP2243074.1 diaminopimelate epimerase [Lentzea aerocolonigenes]